MQLTDFLALQHFSPAFLFYEGMKVEGNG